MYRLKFSKLYDSDVDSTYNYIKDEKESPMAARNLVNEIVVKLDKIKENPRIRPLVQDKYLASFGYRSIRVKNHLIFYIIGDDDKHIKIIRFLYNRRNWANILKEDTNIESL